MEVMMSDIKAVPGFPDYLISKSGEIFSTKRGSYRQLKPCVTNGFYQVSLLNKKSRRTFQLHRLVAMMFVDNPDNFNTVNHLDGNKLNNDVANLRWSNRRLNEESFSKTTLFDHIFNKKEKDLQSRLTILERVHSVCEKEPDLFYAIYKTVMTGVN
jgi:hypothetical protein